MGRWGMGILDSDAALDAYGEYIDLYNIGTDTKEIRSIFEEKNKWEFENNVIEDNTDFWLGLAKAQWECKALDADVLANIRQIVDEEIEREDWIEGYPDRHKVLKRFLSTISKEKSSPRKPVAPKKFSAPFEKGDVIAFLFPDGDFGAAVCLEASEEKEKIASSLIAMTRMKQKSKPTVDEVLASHLLVRTWIGEPKRALPDYDRVPQIRESFVIEVDHLFQAQANELIGKISIERPYTLSWYSSGASWDFARNVSWQLEWEENPNGCEPDLSFPISSMIDLPGDEQWQTLGLLFVEAIDDSCSKPPAKKFLSQMRKMKLKDRDSDLRRFLISFTALHLEKVDSLLRQVRSWNRRG